ncbi:MAG: hypothetical protein ABSB70_05625 [Candidatus Velthaea sp.]|jgi:hypothetical protein
MQDPASTYTSTIVSYVEQAAAIAKERGLHVEINGPFVRLRRRRSSASLTFHVAHLMLEAIEVAPCDRRKHYGSAMLDDVIAIGEALGLRIDLIAESTTRLDGRGLVQSKLEGWYHRHAFVGADDVLMRRMPSRSVGAATPRS